MRPHYSRESPGTHCIGGWVGPGAVWTGAENLASTGMRSPDGPAHNESLHRPSYPGPPYERVLQQKGDGGKYTLCVCARVCVCVYVCIASFLWRAGTGLRKIKSCSQLTTLDPHIQGVFFLLDR
jgi:hypothetical protein